MRTSYRLAFASLLSAGHFYVGSIELAETAFWRQLNAQNDENAVRIAIASGHYNADESGVAKEWLRGKEEERSSSSADKRDAREAEALEIAKEANSIARSASFAATAAAAAASEANDVARSNRRVAIAAAVIAIAAAIAQIIWR